MYNAPNIDIIPNKNMRTLVLASSSQRRKQLLEQLKIPFIVDPSSYEENMSLSTDPHILVRTLANGKTRQVAKKYTDAIVIGADTIIVFSGKILGKPYTKEKAKEMLMALNGKNHTVITGYMIIDTKAKKEIIRSVETKVFFRKISEKDISAYVNSGEPLDKAGAYALQERGVLFMDKIEGDYANIIGLPLTHIIWDLCELGIHIL